MIVFFDTETHRFRPGLMSPPIVCVQWCVDDGPAQLMTARGEFAHEGGALSGPTAHTFSSLFRYWNDAGALFVGHHVAYDMACLCAQDPELVPIVFRAYRENRVTDTMIRQKLADIGRGSYRGFFRGPVWIPLQYDLGAVGGRHGLKVNKDDPWRLHYSLLADVPLAEWPEFEITIATEELGAPSVHLIGEDAIRYALEDSKATRAAYVGQATRYPAELLVDEFNQARKFWALDLASYWGLRTSVRGVLDLERGARERQEELGTMLREAELVRADGSRDTKAAKSRMVRACFEAGVPVRQTKKNDVCLDSDACNSSGDPLLEAYAEYSSMTKVLSNDVAALKKGVVLPIHTHFDIAETGRTTSAKPNVQNPRRLAGVRECFVPRGYVA
jgi:hypothetical protein